MRPIEPSVSAAEAPRVSTTSSVAETCCSRLPNETVRTRLPGGWTRSVKRWDYRTCRCFGEVRKRTPRRGRSSESADERETSSPVKRTGRQTQKETAKSKSFASTKAERKQARTRTPKPWMPEPVASPVARPATSAPCPNSSSHNKVDDLTFVDRLRGACCRRVVADKTLAVAEKFLESSIHTVNRGLKFNQN